jgi:LuxR family maltose regulon positive regulatory protein
MFNTAPPIDDPRWEIQALLLKASAEDALGDTGASSRALERALDLAEPEGLLLPFVQHPRPNLLERHSRLRTAHASLISDILNLLADGPRRGRAENVEQLPDPLSEAELRVLRYLPTNLAGPEIASELFVSMNTIRTHLRSIYCKFGVHSRTQAVNRARKLGLLSSSSRKR